MTEQHMPCRHLPIMMCRLCEGPQTPPDWTPPSAQHTHERSALEKALDALDSCTESTYSSQWTEQVFQRFDAQKVAGAKSALRAAIAKAAGGAA